MVNKLPTSRPLDPTSGVQTREWRHKFLPLIVYVEDFYIRPMKTQRRIRRNTEYDKKWYAKYLPALYGKQLAKLENHRRKMGKSLWELPLTISDLHDGEGVAEIMRDKFLHQHVNCITKPKQLDASLIAEKIQEEELEEDGK